MEFDPESPVCTGCGLVGKSLGTCSQCNFCTFCEVKGHLVAVCKGAPCCSYCGRKDHQALYCDEPVLSMDRHIESFLDTDGGYQITPNIKNVEDDSPSVSDVDMASGNDSDTIASFNQEKDAQHAELSPQVVSGPLNLSIRGYRHDDEEFLNHRSTGSMSIHDAMLFPVSLRDIIGDVAAYIERGENDFLKACNFPLVFRENEGLDQFIQDAMSAIDNDILGLQGKIVTANLLENIRNRQSGPWPSDVGYLDYVTDDRELTYLRFYPGQTNKCKRRLIREHGAAIRSGKKNTLHYFIIWMGNGHRSANFLRLWAVPPRIPKGEYRNATSCVLERVFCFAFSSLPPLMLAECCDVSTRPRSYLGLNVMDPLLQSVRLRPFDKFFYISQAQNSADPEVRLWFEERASLRDSANHGVPIHATAGDYQGALRQAIGDIAANALMSQASDLDVSLAAPSTYCNNLLSRLSKMLLSSRKDGKFTPPYGSMSARVGFISDYVLDDEGVPAEELHTSLPRVFDDMGFDESNSLSWTFDFCHRRQLEPTSFKAIEPGSPIENVIMLCHRSVIHESELSIVFLCGPDAERFVLGSCQEVSRANLKLRGRSIVVFTESDPTSGRQRLYIRCPDMSTGIRPFLSGSLSKLGGIIKFASTLTRTENTRPWYLECGFALRFVAIQFDLERRGHPAATSKTISPGMKSWLARRGFEAAHIQKLETSAKSLIAGLLILIQCIRGRNHRRTQGTGQFIKFTEDEDLDEIDLAAQELLNDHPRLDSAIGTIAELFDARSRAGLDESLPEPRRHVFQKEYQDLVDMNHFNYPSGTGSESYLDLLEESAQVTSSGIEINKEVILTNSNLTTRYLPSEKVAKIQDWSRESEFYKHRGYKYLVTNRNDGTGSKILIGNVRIFPRRSDYDDGMEREVTVFIEISEPGVRHRNVFAINAPSEDPASRVAFLVVAKRSDGSTTSFYPTSKGESQVIFRVNSLADKLLEGATIQQILGRPRRFVRLKSTNVPERQRFLGGGDYTSPV